MCPLHLGQRPIPPRFSTVGRPPQQQHAIRPTRGRGGRLPSFPCTLCGARGTADTPRHPCVSLARSITRACSPAPASHSPNLLRRPGSARLNPNFFGTMHRLIGAGRSGRGQGLGEYAPPRVSISLSLLFPLVSPWRGCHNLHSPSGWLDAPRPVLNERARQGGVTTLFSGPR